MQEQKERTNEKKTIEKKKKEEGGGRKEIKSKMKTKCNSKLTIGQLVIKGLV